MLTPKGNGRCLEWLWTKVIVMSLKNWICSHSKGFSDFLSSVICLNWTAPHYVSGIYHNSKHFTIMWSMRCLQAINLDDNNAFYEPNTFSLPNILRCSIFYVLNDFFVVVSMSPPNSNLINPDHVIFFTSPQHRLGPSTEDIFFTF